MATFPRIDPLPQPSARAVVAGVAFIGAALAFLAGIVTPSVDYDTPGAALAKIAGDPGAFLNTWILDMLYALLLVPALLGAASVPRGRGATLAYAGATLALLGNLGHMLICAVDLVALNMVAPAANQAEMVALLTRMSNQAGLMIVLPMMLSFVIGLVVLTVGLWRTGLIPVWPLVLMFAAAGIDFFSFGPAGETAKSLAGAAASIWIGVALIRHAYASRAGSPKTSALAMRPNC